jgi:UDP-MurNAc hydroxylase
VEIVSLGHAGFFVRTRYGSVLCDPWFNPAFYGSWFPFPSNEWLDIDSIKHPTYLYVSHLHQDHFDARFLKEHVWKGTTVLLPDYPLDHMEQELRNLGFTRFVNTKNLECVELDGLEFSIVAQATPTDGPLGDSGLILDDGETRIFDQNDCRLIDTESVASLGPFDAHLLQFSGAVWYPIAYEMPEKAKLALGTKKRSNQMARALRYIRQIDAAYVFPSAGPPCFLDDELFYLNDFNRSPTNIFPDQGVFLDYMEDHGMTNGRLLIPGSTATLQNGACKVEHPISESEFKEIFSSKRDYLTAYKARKQSQIDALRTSWQRGQVEILPSLREWFEPLLEQADLNCVGINGKILLDCNVERVVIDFHKRRVYEPVEGADVRQYDYQFRVDPGLVEQQIINHEVDWVNSLFLSLRFTAKRKGTYNEYVFGFFKVLSPDRICYAEEYYSQVAPVRQLWECAGFKVQRSCPHLKADLTRFGEEKDGILTCMVHGWQFDLTTGQCLTTDDVRLYTKSADYNGSQSS